MPSMSQSIPMYLVALALAACQVGRTSLDHEGVRYVFPIQTGIVLTVTGDHATMLSRGLELRVVGRRMTLNGSDYGEARPGEVVTVTPDGRLLVDGIERAVVSMPEDGRPR